MPTNLKSSLPLVSVIVPCYNHEKYIIECVNSLINQTYTNFELTIIDDGSTDKSFEILTDLKRKYDFNLVHQENKGLPVTINRAIREYANGKYITFCASDDYWCLDKLEKQINFMEENKEFAMCYGRSYYVDADSNPLKVKNVNFKGGWIFDDLFTYKFHPPVNYLFRASVFREVGYYDETICAEDYYMNLKIANRYPIGYINDYLSFYRVSINPVKISRINEIFDSQLKAIEEYKTHYLYKKAKKAIYLHKLDWLSGFKQTKRLALKDLFKPFPKIFNKEYCIVLIKLLVIWR